MNNKEIAALLGISTATVSLAINNKKGVSEKTQKKVLELYNHSMLSSIEKFQKKTMKGKLMFCFLKKYGDVISDIPYFLNISESIYEKATSEGYELQISHLMPHSDIDTYLNNIKKVDVDGIILMATEISSCDIDKFKSINKPFVAIDNWFYGKDVDCVHMDNIDGIVQAMEYLFSMGHTQIGYVQSSFFTTLFNERFLGYELSLRNKKIKFDEEYIYYAHPSNKGAYIDMVKQLKEKRKMPTALIVSNDLMAIGVINALKENNYNIPQDISVVGFDDISDAYNIMPPLTSLRINHGMIAKSALEILLHKIQNKYNIQGTFHSMITVDLIIRDSVLDINK